MEYQKEASQYDNAQNLIAKAQGILFSTAETLEQRIAKNTELILKIRYVIERLKPFPPNDIKGAEVLVGGSLEDNLQRMDESMVYNNHVLDDISRHLDTLV